MTLTPIERTETELESEYVEVATEACTDPSVDIDT